MADPAGIYGIHGLTVESEYALDAGPAPGKADGWAIGAPDYVIRRGAPRAAAGRPAGRPIAASEAEGRAYRLVERDDGSWLMQYPGLAEFEIRGSRITAHLAPGAAEGYVPVLIAGGLIAALRTAPGHLVLHASAVEVDGSAIAVLGGSGAGKSATAAHLCQAGASLVTDDTLAVAIDDEVNDAQPRCFRGTRTIRLRAASEQEFNGLDGWATGRSVDGRLELRPPAVEHSELPLGAVLVVQRSGDPGEIRIRHHTGSEAAKILFRNPRTVGWRDADRIRDNFRGAASLAERVKVLAALIPERPPADPPGAELLAALSEALAG